MLSDNEESLFIDATKAKKSLNGSSKRNEPQKDVEGKIAQAKDERKEMASCFLGVEEVDSDDQIIYAARDDKHKHHTAATGAVTMTEDLDSLQAREDETDDTSSFDQTDSATAKQKGTSNITRTRLLPDTSATQAKKGSSEGTTERYKGSKRKHKAPDQTAALSLDSEEAGAGSRAIKKARKSESSSHQNNVTAVPNSGSPLRLSAHVNKNGKWRCRSPSSINEKQNIGKGKSDFLLEETWDVPWEKMLESDIPQRMSQTKSDRVTTNDNSSPDRHATSEGALKRGTSSPPPVLISCRDPAKQVRFEQYFDTELPFSSPVDIADSMASLPPTYNFSSDDDKQDNQDYLPIVVRHHSPEEYRGSPVPKFQHDSSTQKYNYPQEPVSSDGYGTHTSLQPPYTGYQGQLEYVYQAGYAPPLQFSSGDLDAIQYHHGNQETESHSNDMVEYPNQQERERNGYGLQPLGDGEGQVDYYQLNSSSDDDFMGSYDRRFR